MKYIVCQKCPALVEAESKAFRMNADGMFHYLVGICKQCGKQRMQLMDPNERDNER